MHDKILGMKKGNKGIRASRCTAEVMSWVQKNTDSTGSTVSILVLGLNGELMCATYY
jgi:hypothetical protein